jgi:hypothetical protein
MAAGRIMSMKNSNDTIGNRSRDLPVPPRAPYPKKRAPKRNELEAGYATQWDPAPVDKRVSGPSQNPDPTLRSSHIYPRSDIDSAYPLYIDWASKM